MSNTGASLGVTVGRADPWSCNEPLDGFKVVVVGVANPWKLLKLGGGVQLHAVAHCMPADMELMVPYVRRVRPAGRPTLQCGSVGSNPPAERARERQTERERERENERERERTREQERERETERSLLTIK